MADKKTSDEIASIAGRILAGGDPFENTQVRMALQRAIYDGVHCSSPSGVVTLRVPDRVVDNIEAVLKPYIQNMLSLAGSAVAQADG